MRAAMQTQRRYRHGDDSQDQYFLGIMPGCESLLRDGSRRERKADLSDVAMRHARSLRVEGARVSGEALQGEHSRNRREDSRLMKGDYQDCIDRHRKEIIESAIHKGGNLSSAAKLLKMELRTLYRWVRILGIRLPKS